MTAGFRRLSDRRALLGESPAYSEKEGCVWWIDIEGRLLLRTDVGSGATTAWPTPGTIGFAVLWEDGLLAGVGRSLYLFDPRTGAFTHLSTPLPDDDVRFNDAAVDPAGGVWAGTMDVANRRDVGCICRIEPDFTATPVFGGLITPNGIAAGGSPGHLYFSDSHKDIRTIWRAPLDAASGAPGARETFRVMRDLPGRPDGAAFDEAGNYWIAGVDGGELYCFTPPGEPARKVSVPVARPTKLAFMPGEPGWAWMTSKADGAAGDGGYLSCVNLCSPA